MGKLKSLGIEQPWQVPLCCPIALEDYRTALSDFMTVYNKPGEKVFVQGRLASIPSFDWVRGKGVLTITLYDPNNYHLTIKLFGDTRELQESMCTLHDTYYFTGVAFPNGRYLNLRAAQQVHERDVGQLCPVYAGKRGVITPDTTKKQLHERLMETLPVCESHIRERLGEVNNIRQLVGAKTLSLGSALYNLHFPQSREKWDEAKHIIKRVAALSCVRELQSTTDTDIHQTSPKRADFDVQALLSAIPFSLTDEQHHIIKELCIAIREGNTLDAMLIGDVGTGKTVVYGAAAAACATSGGKVAIMLPSQSLALQIFSEIEDYWPHLRPALVTNETGELEDTNLYIGTSALLHRALPTFDMVIVDEQQRFGIEQRDALCAPHTHKIEVTATPIPRTQALIKFGNARRLFRLTRCHADKNITTKLRLKKDSNELMRECLSEIQQGNKILVVCPTKESSDNFVSVEEVYQKWHKFARGKVRYMHSGCEPSHNAKALKDIKSDKASVLVATTMVEIGITIPKLTKTVIYHAERFGTITCHQIRGRLVRHGGNGQLDLYCPEPISDKSLARLSLLTHFNDGFELATEDMKLRGFGDVVGSDSKEQHGATKSILIGEAIDIGDVEDLICALM